MWPTVDGVRVLQGREADLVRRSADALLQRLAEHRGADPYQYGIDWFDQWDDEQKRWLIQQVTAALLTEQPPLRAAAMC